MYELNYHIREMQFTEHRGHGHGSPACRRYAHSMIFLAVWTVDSPPRPHYLLRLV